MGVKTASCQLHIDIHRCATRPIQMAAFIDSAEAARESLLTKLRSSIAPRCQNSARRSTPRRLAVAIFEASAFCVCECSAGLCFCQCVLTSRRIIGDVPERSQCRSGRRDRVSVRMFPWRFGFAMMHLYEEKLSRHCAQACGCTQYYVRCVFSAKKSSVVSLRELYRKEFAGSIARSKSVLLGLGRRARVLGVFAARGAMLLATRL